ncbi:DUF4873 domain-containing protein [Salinifilum aidingensis]
MDTMQHEHAQDHEHDEDDYNGPALVFTADREITVDVVLRGNFQPIDGRFRWYGRTRPSAELDELTGGKKARVVLRTEQGEAAADLSEPDPWGRYRITGTGAPPFHVPDEHELDLDAAGERG